MGIVFIVCMYMCLGMLVGMFLYISVCMCALAHVWGECVYMCMHIYTCNYIKLIIVMLCAYFSASVLLDLYTGDFNYKSYVLLNCQLVNLHLNPEVI